MKRKDFLASLFGGFLGVSLIDQLANEGAALLEAEALPDDEWTFTLLNEWGEEVSRPVRCRVEERAWGLSTAEPIEFPTFDRDVTVSAVRVRGTFDGHALQRDVPIRTQVCCRPGDSVRVEYDQEKWWT